MPTHSLNDLPPLLREMLETNSYRDKAGAAQPLHSNISKDEALALYSLVRSIKPAATAEIGFALGISGLAILGAHAANGSGRHYVTDPFQSNLVNGMGLEHVRRAGLDTILEFHEKFPEEVFPTLPRLQFAFIDASHLFDLSILDFIMVDKRLDVGGAVGFHDLWMPSLRKLIRYLLANRAYRIHPENPQSPPPTGRQKVFSSAAALARNLPGAGRWLAPEAAKPWHEFGIANLVILEKIGEDKRDWREHHAF